MRLNDTDRLLMGALLPSGEELADRARDEDPSLSPGEALAVGHYGRRLILETLEKAAANIPGGPDVDDPPPVASFDQLLEALTVLCLEEARGRLDRGD